VQNLQLLRHKSEGSELKYHKFFFEKNQRIIKIRKTFIDARKNMEWILQKN